MKKQNFTQHIIRIILLGILIPLALSLIITVIYNARTLRRETISLQRQRLAYTQAHIESYFSSVSASLKVLSDQLDIQSAFSRMPDSDALSTISTSLANFCYIYPNYSNAYVCSNKDRSVYSAYPETTGVVSYEDLRASAWYAHIASQYYYGVSVYPFSQGNYLACVQPEYDPVTLEFQGYCMAKLKASVFESFFKLYQDDTALLLCITESGQSVFCPEGAADFDASELARAIAHTPQRDNFSFGTYLVCYCPISYSDFFILSLIPKDAYQTQSLIPGLFGIALAIFSIGIGLMICIFYLRRFLQPIHDMADIMHNADLNNLTPISLTHRDDELAKLERGYNDMVKNFNDLLDREYKASLAMQNAQLNALQLQINPHFVNNTLQMIGAIAVEHSCMDIYELLQSFSSMFYYCLKYKGNIVTVNDELEYLKHYILLQAKRFPDKFEVTFETDPQVLSSEIPKMVLQPIVENCFSHGFDFTHSGWRIMLRAAQEGSTCCIEIRDNGCGMDADTLSQLRAQIAQTGPPASQASSRSIGLQNVNTRLRLLYGEPYQLSIFSAPGEGTRVILRIPKTHKEGLHADTVDRR